MFIEFTIKFKFSRIHNEASPLRNSFSSNVVCDLALIHLFETAFFTNYKGKFLTVRFDFGNELLSIIKILIQESSRCINSRND